MYIYVDNVRWRCHAPAGFALKCDGYYECMLFNEKNVPERIVRIPFRWFDVNEHRTIYTSGEWISKQPLVDLTPPKSKGDQK